MTKKNFDKLPIAEQRVVIAKDLIARLDAKKFVAAGGYFQSSSRVLRSEIADDNVQVKEIFAGKVCRGCQIGGLFAAAIDRCNALKLSELVSQHSVGHSAVNVEDIRLYLTRWFTERMIRQLEHVYEGWDNADYGDFTPFADAFEREERMRIICKNIIKNKGTFKPAQILELAKGE